MSAREPDEVNRIFGSAPFIAALGIRLESAGNGECATVLDVQAAHLQQDGYVHAGVLTTMADHTAGGAAATVAPAGTIVLSAQLSVHLLRPARGERLRCRARVLKAGRLLAVVESEVHCQAGADERLVAKLTGTMALVDPARRDAAG